MNWILKSKLSEDHMNTGKIKDIITQDRGVFYGCSTDTFFKEGTTFRNVESLNGKNTLYLTKLFNHHFVSAGKELISFLSDLSEGGKKPLELKNIEERFTEFTIEDSFPHFIYPGETIPVYPLPDGYGIRTVDPANHPPLQAFLDTCTADDIEEALIDLKDPDEEIRLVYHGNKAIGYAGYRRWGKCMGDVGILIHSDHRKRGLGVAAVAAVTAACLENGHLPFYRTSSDNRGSASIAENLGYELKWITTECQCTV
jgi:GNAT superfamily N-acetyltransferase